MALNYSFAGKRVLVTGGGQGLGKALVKRLSEDGAIVFTVDKNPETIEQLKKTFPNVTAEVVDLSDWDATRKVVDDGFGVIDHLVNNAGMIITERFMDISKETAAKQFDVNLFAIINISQVVAKKLKESGQPGSIVNISSFRAKLSTEWSPIYGATKAAVENLTKTMAVDLGPHNIRINAIAPGIVQTPIHDSYIKGGATAAVEQMIDRLVIKRPAKPDEIVDLILFLLSPLSTMICGETVAIDQGILIT